MHARCDSDPLDFATDLCDHCGGEFCNDHLIHPYGLKRPPLCKDCAIAAAGLRSGGGRPRTRTRGEIRRRRAELRAESAPPRTLAVELMASEGEPDERPAPAPDAVPAAAPPAEAPAPGAATGRLARLRRRAAPPPPAPAPPEPRFRARPEPTPARTSATVLLERLRESGAVPTGSPRPLTDPGESPLARLRAATAARPDGPGTDRPGPVGPSPRHRVPDPEPDAGWQPEQGWQPAPAPALAAEADAEDDPWALVPPSLRGPLTDA